MTGDLVQSIAAACEFLVDRQDSDGHWRDFELASPSIAAIRSDSWITGCVGVALDRAERLFPLDANLTRAIDHAVAVLRDSQRAMGWGYCRYIRCDADSTSWVVRLLAARDKGSTISASLFGDYLTAAGGVRTYPSHAKHKSWAYEHDEVTPMAGLALLALGDKDTVDLIRMRILSRYREHGGWQRFWWRSDAYVVAHNLTFLACSGGIPPQLAAAEWKRSSEFIAEWKRSTEQGQESPFDIAQRLITAVYLHASRHVDQFRRTLLAAQLPDGGWPASRSMLVSTQRKSSFADDRRLLTTAMSVLALVDVVLESEDR